MGTIVPNMGTLRISDSISSALFPKTRKAILSALFTEPDREFYLREIIRLVNAGQGAVERELRSLHKSGLILRQKKGNQVFFKANPDSPIFNELKSIIIKTAGVGDIIKSSLIPVADKINCAFIYGSFAKGTERPSSDIDLMVIGSVSLREIVRAVTPAQKQLNREINPSVMSRSEFITRQKKRDSYIADVIKSDKIMLIGDRNELEILV